MNAYNIVFTLYRVQDKKKKQKDKMIRVIRDQEWFIKDVYKFI